MRGAAAPRAKATPASEPDRDITIEFGVDLAAPLTTTFAAVTRAAHLPGWFCDEADSDPRKGGALRMVWHRPEAGPQPFVGHWTSCEPPHAAAFTGGHPGYPGGNAGIVRFELSARPGGTRLNVTHVMPARPEFVPIADRYRDAWPRALARLARHVSSLEDPT